MPNHDQEMLSIQELSEQEGIRREKLKALQAEGKDPYALVKYPVSAFSNEIISQFDALENQRVYIAGRMISKRVMGKASFAHILDSQGTMQVYIKRDDIGQDEYTAFKTMDIGDIIGVSGIVFRTQKGEISVHASEVVLLTKSLKPLPEKFHGLKDMDLRYRQRYVDMIVNPEVRETFRKRSKIIASVREFLDSRGFLEVDTPVLHTIETGAAARTFKTHHNTLDIDMFLRIETELYLKRLIVGGFDKVYEVGRIFRNEGMDSTHNPEFTSVELYEAYVDYEAIMALVEELYEYVAIQALGSTKVPYGEHEVDLKAPWPRMTMAEAVKQRSGVDYFDWQSDEQAREACKSKGVKVEPTAKRGDCLSELFDAFVEDTLIQPTFIIDYPVDISPLAKRKPGQPDLTERFEFFICGTEMGNAFSELNDPIDQRRRFEEQVATRKAQGIEAQVDEDFITALEYGMPPTGGLGFGLDRLVMLLTNNTSIRDVMLFPTMKPRD